MKVTGFSFIRNAIKFDYPIVEAVRSVLPLCDDFVVAVGKSDDNTLELIQSIDKKKIKIIETIWNDNLREGGKVLSEETNKAFRAISDESDWAFYIQGDEAVNEKYFDAIHSAMKKWKDDKRIDGLLFKYLHFYGSYDFIGSSPGWYQNEIRVIRNDKNIYSYRDAQGFRKGNNEKLRVKAIDAYIHHYGWVKEPTAMQRKQETFNKLYHDDSWVEKNVIKATEFDYAGHIDAVAKFTGTHPIVMQERIERINWKFERDISFNHLSVKNRFKLFVQKWLGIQLGYKNYKLV
ncbi:MAG: hypothetical protein JXB34_00830 [Bacteroidales bacterium]|nr:hypothetical protein [Bacteroidales bacterium]